MSIHNRPLEYMFPYGMGIIFDSDGVVVDSEPVSLEAFRRVYHEVGIEADEDDLQATIGRTDASTVSLMWERYGYFMDAEEFFERRKKHYQNLVDERGIPAFPGVEELLDELTANHVPFALASSDRPEKIELNLKAACFQGRFPVVVSGADIDLGKPDPEIYLLAASQLSLPPERCIAIEDANVGVEAAKRAGMGCIAVTNTFSARLLAGADCVVQSLEQVNLNLLRKIFEQLLQRAERV